MDKERLKILIAGLLKELKTAPKVKLAKLILFSEIEHFRKTGKSFTGLYFVRLRKGPVIAFFDETLEEGSGTLWNKEVSYIPIFEEGREKSQHSYTLIKEMDVPEDLQKTIAYVVSNYGSKSGTELSLLSHNIPAWRYSEPNEPLYAAELSAETDKEYFALVDLIEDIEEDDDEILSKKILPSLPAAQRRV
jgi:uncharacterized phage-associated protein